MWADVEYKHWIPKCRGMLRDGEAVESIIAFLKNDGADFIQSTVVIAESLSISQTDAEILLNKSQAWADFLRKDRRNHRRLMRTLAQALKHLKKTWK